MKILKMVNPTIQVASITEAKALQLLADSANYASRRRSDGGHFIVEIYGEIDALELKVMLARTREYLD